VYLKRGKLTKQPCQVCGNPDSQMHHEDYDKPLDVTWLCLKHHLEKHDCQHDALPKQALASTPPRELLGSPVPQVVHSPR
jgi:hypothetical protein